MQNRNALNAAIMNTGPTLVAVAERGEAEAALTVIGVTDSPPAAARAWCDARAAYGCSLGVALALAAVYTHPYGTGYR